MKRIARFVVKHSLLAWLIVLAVVVTNGFVVSEVAHRLIERARLSQLDLVTQQRASDIESQTLNGKKMGAMALVGLIDGNVKREARGELAANSPEVLAMIQSVSRAHYADGAFVVGADGRMKSSWRDGQVTTGTDLKFRPYFQTAMKGTENIYAAVGTNSGERTLYFSAPVHEGNDNESPIIGAVVMRAGVEFLAPLLASPDGDSALLLSPQGVVFASNHDNLVGLLAGPASPERVKAIRELKQFGKKFDERDPELLSFDPSPGLTKMGRRSYAIARVPVKWNDPGGDWSLVLVEDLSRTVSPATRWRVGLSTAGLSLLLGWILIYLFRARYGRLQAGEQLAAYARAQQAITAHKAELAAVGLRMQQAADLDELFQCYFEEARRVFGALQGVAYLVDQASPTILNLAGRYACIDSPPPHLELGAGLLGQCALERRTQIIEAVPEGFGVIRSGLGDTAPVAVLLGPILQNGVLLGVVELALLTTPGETERKQFEETTTLLAMNLGILDRRVDIEQMLALTRAAEESKAEQLLFQQVMVDTIPYPVFFKGSDTRFLGFNTAYEEIFKVRRADLIGKRVMDLDYLPEADRIAYQAEDEAVIASVGKVKRPMKIPFADGQMHNTIYYVSGFRKLDGSPGGLVGSFIDLGVAEDVEVLS